MGGRAEGGGHGGGGAGAAGHGHGWMGKEYLAALNQCCDMTGELIEALGDEYAVIYTADHGGHGRSHGTEQPEDMTIPIFCLGKPFEAGKAVEGLTIQDIAPTIASLLGVELPLALEWETLVRLERRERKLTKEQMKTAALLKLREAQRTALGEGGSVLHEELSFTFAEGRCMVSARCRCQENIGEIQVVSTN